jgi:hypothetical protein
VSARADPRAPELELRFLGPLVTVENVEDHLPLFAHVFGLEARSIQELDAAEVQALWGVEGRAAGTVLLETGDSRVGVRLVQFARARGVDAGRPRAVPESGPARELRFLTRDFEVARHAVERAGFAFRSVSRFSAEGCGRLTEARLQGADGVCCSVLRMHDRAMQPWVRVTDRLFGELLSVAVALADVDEAAAFYELLGLRRVSLGSQPGAGGEGAAGAGAREVSEATARYGAPAGVEARESVTVGSAARAPMITLVSDLAAPAGSSSLEEALLAQRGVVGLRFECASVDRVRRRLSSVAGQCTGARVLSLGRGILEPLGAVESMMVSGPGGVVHQFVGRM